MSKQKCEHTTEKKPGKPTRCKKAAQEGKSLCANHDPESPRCGVTLKNGNTCTHPRIIGLHCRLHDPGRKKCQKCKNPSKEGDIFCARHIQGSVSSPGNKQPTLREAVENLCSQVSLLREAVLALLPEKERKTLKERISAACVDDRRDSTGGPGENSKNFVPHLFDILRDKYGYDLERIKETADRFLRDDLGEDEYEWIYSIILCPECEENYKRMEALSPGGCPCEYKRKAFHETKGCLRKTGYGYDSDTFISAGPEQIEEIFENLKEEWNRRNCRNPSHQLDVSIRPRDGKGKETQGESDPIKT